MASVDTWIEIGVYVAGAIGAALVLAHVFKPPVSTPPLSFAGAAPCGCGKTL